MKRLDLTNKIIDRKKQLHITVENLAKLSGVSIRTVNRVLKNEDVKLSTIEDITNLLGLDFAGNEQYTSFCAVNISIGLLPLRFPAR